MRLDIRPETVALMRELAAKNRAAGGWVADEPVVEAWSDAARAAALEARRRNKGVVDAVKHGGGTVGADHGFAVAVKGHSSITKLDDFRARPGKVVKTWLQEHKAAFADPNVHVGVWFDAQHGEVVLDPAEVVDDRDEAVRRGTERNQQAIYDLDAGVEIPTGGTGDR